MNIKTEVQGPDEIRINLIREDYLDTSHTFRIFFEVCLAVAGTVLGNIISLLNDKKELTFINWLFLLIMISGCIAFLVMTSKNYKKSKVSTEQRLINSN